MSQDYSKEKDASRVLETGYENGQSMEKVAVEIGESMPMIDPKAERRLVWKFDLRILPVLAIMVSSY